MNEETTIYVLSKKNREVGVASKVESWVARGVGIC